MTRVTTFARKARELVVKIEGPVSRMAIIGLKDLHIALGHKIAELEELGHWDRSTVATATTPTGKAQATTGCVSNVQDTEPAL